MPSYPISVDDNSPFPIENLPLGIFSTGEAKVTRSVQPVRCIYNKHALTGLLAKAPRAGTAIGDYVLDLALLEQKGSFSNVLNGASSVFSQVPKRLLRQPPESL